MSGTSKMKRVLLVALVAIALAMPALPAMGAVSASSGTTVMKSAAAAGTVLAEPKSPAVFTPLSTTYVYITRTGSKYHRGGCRYLRTSKRKVTLRYAKSHGFGACKVCRPPR